MNTEDDPFESYTVVINHEEQYSIWPTVRTLPLGWSEVGIKGPKSECLAHIEKVWIDMRPLSLRKAMELKTPSSSEMMDIEREPLENLPPLPVRLAARPQSIEICLRPEKTPAAFKACLDRGFVKVRFTDTNGGTEVGFKIDPRSVEYIDSDFGAGRGEVVIRGNARIDFVPLECVAKVSLASLAGSATITQVS